MDPFRKSTQSRDFLYYRTVRRVFLCQSQSFVLCCTVPQFLQNPWCWSLRQQFFSYMLKSWCSISFQLFYTLEFYGKQPHQLGPTCGDDCLSISEDSPSLPVIIFIVLQIKKVDAKYRALENFLNTDMVLFFIYHLTALKIHLNLSACQFRISLVDPT